MQVSNVQVHTTEKYCQLDAEIQSDHPSARPFSLYYRFPAECSEFVTPQNGDPFLAALLAPAMAAGEPITVDASVSPQLNASLDQIQDIYRCWHRGFRKIEIEAPIRSQQLSTERSRVGLFFSLGVDSFYSLLKNIRRHPTDAASISDLLLVKGFDVRENKKPGLFETVLSQATTVADNVGKTLVPISTNLREFADRYVSWGSVYHGAALASVALAMEGMLRRVHIAASHTYNHMIPRGSHALLDPLWSTEGLRFIHDGCEATRMKDKLHVIAQSPIALRSLRVCYKNFNSQYNCGRCNKCLQTMLGLYVMGALKNCSTLPADISITQIRNLAQWGVLLRFEELLEALHDPDCNALDAQTSKTLEQILEDAVARGEKDALEDHAWQKRRRRQVQEILRIAQPARSIILVDEDRMRGELPRNVRAFPFLERDGSYWGKPKDDQEAIEELERLRKAGAELIVFAEPASWWLDYYSGFHEYLRTRYACVGNGHQLTVFDLSQIKTAGAD